MPTRSTDVRTEGATRRASAGRTAALALVGFAVGAGGMLAGTRLSRAADDAGALDFIIGEARRAVPFLAPRRAEPAPVAAFAAAAPVSRGFAEVERVRRPTAFTALKPLPFKASTSTGVAASVTPWTGGTAPTRSVCVRTCDGYAFPLGNLSSRGDLASHAEGCAAACPGAPTALYTLPVGGDLQQAVSVSGQPYARLATAGLHTRRFVEGCSCAGTNRAMTPIAQDGTLRPGDVVARVQGAVALVAAGGAARARFVEFRQAGVLTAAARRDVDRVTGTTRREVARAAFARLMHSRQVAANAGPPIRVASADGFSVLASSTAFTPIRVILPMPYRLAALR